MGALLVTLSVIAGLTSRTSKMRQLVIETLAERFDSEIELAWFSVDTFPTVDIRGEGLVVRRKAARELPPLIKVASFRITGGMWGLLSRPRRFRTVTVDGLEINIPPGGAKIGGSKDDAVAGSPPSSGAGPSSAPPQSPPPIRVDALVSNDAVLRLIPRHANKDPKEFLIQSLRMQGVGAEAQMPFQAELTNPKPRGSIQTSGRFGPWNRTEPGGTPVAGSYVFDDADLSTIKGIGGILASTGDFKGQLGRIEVTGETRTPDFHLDVSGKPVPLTTTFAAVVDGTDGDTYLNAVDAKLRDTAIFASGAVTGTKGVKGRSVELHVKVSGGRMEDLLDLAMKSEEPVLSGQIALHTDFTLPPGEADVIERLRLNGEFDLAKGEFSDPGVREKLASMSQRARGADPARAPDSVVTDLEGKFRLSNALLTLTALQFRIPGATVRLAGSYGLRTEAIEMDGSLRMQATISEAAGGGIKGALLKLVDPLFRKKGAGAVIPIKVRGTRSDPKFGVDVVRALTPR